MWWKPSDVPLETWNGFLVSSVVIGAFIVVVVYFLYRYILYRLIKILKVDDVFKQCRPWQLTFWLVLLLQVLVPFVVGLFKIESKTAATIFGILIVSVIEGIVFALIYWLLSIIFRLRPRVKYAPCLGSGWPVKR